jgi:hypothetical protein
MSRGKNEYVTPAYVIFDDVALTTLTLDKINGVFFLHIFIVYNSVNLPVFWRDYTFNSFSKTNRNKNVDIKFSAHDAFLE